MTKVLRNEPLFSIILPAYNRKSCIERAINSVVGQSFCDLELIIIDDGSADETSEIISGYSLSDRRIKVINKMNHGVSSARNDGISIATGEYILFLDSDDMLKKDCCLLLSKVLHTQGPDICCFGIDFGGGIWRPDEKFCHRIYDSRFIYECVIPEHINIKPKGDYSLKPFVCNKCFGRSLIEKYDIQFDESKKLWEDNSFCVDCLAAANELLIIGDVLIECGDSGQEDHLSAYVGTHIIDVFIKNYDNYRFKFSFKYNFDNEHTNNYYFNNICRLLIRLRQNIPKEELKEYINRLRRNKNINLWIVKSTVSDKNTLRIKKAFLTDDTDKIYRSFKAKHQNENVLSRLQLLAIRIVRRAKKLCKEYLK